MRKINIFFFSGTGNTFRVVEAIKEELKSEDVKVFKIEDSKTLSNCDLIILSFPIAVFFTYPFIIDFVKKLPDGNGTDIVVIPTMGGFSFFLKSYLRDILISKNYNPVGYKEIIMPDNFMPKGDKVRELDVFTRGLKNARVYIKEVLDNNTVWEKSYFKYFLSVFFYPIYKTIFYFLRKKIKLNKKDCIKCGLCIENCPIENIVMEDFPIFLGRCQLCMRCISFCPSGAITSFSKIRYRAEGVESI